MEPSTLPECTELLLVRRGMVLNVTLNRPRVRNAMNMAMVRELNAIFDAIRDDRTIRAVVLSGAGGHFCAGADISDINAARKAEPLAGSDPFFELNRSFGRMIARVNTAPQVVIAMLEGTVLGGGFGLACVSDVAVAHCDTTFAMPETGLGIPPAQIAPFVVRRIGLTQARMLALTGTRIDGQQALQLGLVHFNATTGEEMHEILERQLELVSRCAPNATAATKNILLGAGNADLDALLDGAAREFAAALRGEEGHEGTAAFAGKRRPAWDRWERPDG